MTEQMLRLNREMQDLCHEVDSLQERALLRVETIENDFHGEVLPDGVKERFKRLQRLITKV